MDLSLNLSLERGFSLLVLFIFFYAACLLVFFSLIFSASRASLGSILGLRYLNNFFFYKFAALLTLLALAGLPPMLGFFIKGLLVSFFFYKGILFTFFFILFNLFSLYFYLSISRSLVLGSSKAALLSQLGRARTSLSSASALLLALWLLLALPVLLDSLLILVLNLVS